MKDTRTLNELLVEMNKNLRVIYDGTFGIIYDKINSLLASIHNNRR